MAEVGLLPFARIALQVSKAVLPRYRSRFSKHQFTQPQLLAILCLMRYEDWTFREAEVRLGEHRELRQTLGLVSVPDFTTLYRFLQRLDDQTIDRAVGETVRRLRGSRHRGRRRARVAVDATGLAQGAVSTFFVRRMHHHGQKPLPWRHWLKWVVVADLDQQFLLSQIARRGPWNDCANLPAVVKTASQQTRIGLVLADAEFDSERNHTYIWQRLGARSVIPAKRGKKTWRVHGVRAEMRRAFPRQLYRRRALIETLFSSVKRKLSARAPGRSLRMQVRQALLLGLSFNLYRLKHRYLFLRMSTEPSCLINTLWGSELKLRHQSACKTRALVPEEMVLSPRLPFVRQVLVFIRFSAVKGGPRIYGVRRTVQPGITQRESPEHGILETCFLKGPHQFVLRVPLGMPPPLDENFCFRSLPRDQHQNAATRGHACMQCREGAWEILFRQILKHRSRQYEVIICPRRRQSLKGEYVRLAELHSGYTAGGQRFLEAG